MAIALVNSASYYQTADVSAAFDATGANYLLVGIVTLGTINSITYNSAAFTQHLNTSLAIDGVPTVSANFIWYGLANPTAGSNTFVLDTSVVADPTFTFILALSGVNTNDAVEGTDTDTATTGSADISITQASNVSSFMAVVGSVRASTTGANYNDTDSTPAFTELIDSQGIVGDNNAGRYVHYGTFEGSGAKTYAGSNNYTTPDRHSDIAILLNGSSTAKAQMITFD